MSALYGTVQGERGQATKCGHRTMTTHAASWDGCIVVDLSFDKATGKTTYDISEQPWRGEGIRRQIESGVIGGVE